MGSTLPLVEIVVMRSCLVTWSTLTGTSPLRLDMKAASTITARMAITMPRQTCLPLPLFCLVRSAIRRTKLKYIGRVSSFLQPLPSGLPAKAANQMPPGLVSAQRHLQKSAFHLNPLIAYVYMGLAMRIGLRRAKEVTQAVYREVQRTRVLNMAAGLSYYFLLSLFPLLIVLATLLGYLPIPNLFNHSMDFAARFVPSEAMGLVRRILQSVLTPNRGGLLSMEVLYFLGPNVKQRFKHTLPGALAGTVLWILISAAVNVYVSHFANYNKTYGTIGAVVALLFWLYVSSIAILIGAELNAELLKVEGERLQGQQRVAPGQLVEMPKAA